jgi:hypothetical protein
VLSGDNRRPNPVQEIAKCWSLCRVLNGDLILAFFLRQIADEPKAAAFHHSAGQPARDYAHDYDD